jgi:hypothetical protein
VTTAAEFFATVEDIEMIERAAGGAHHHKM